ncbi:RNA-binding protein [Vibrio phage EniLVp02]
MSLFMQAMNNIGTTANGAVTFKSSLNHCVDFFFLAGASRGKSGQFVAAFKKALVQDEETAIRTLLHTRDVRGGVGERQVVRDAVKWLISVNQDLAFRILPKMPALGRWDDVLTYFGTPLEQEAVALVLNALLNERDFNCAKWMPRKGENANNLRRAMKTTPKKYRKLLAALSAGTVEQLIDKGEYDKIDFGKLPSIAAKRYQKHFGKVCPERYGAYIESLQKGEAKINAAAIFPHDVVMGALNGNDDVASEQWKALPNYMEGSDEMIMPVIDVSGSMGMYSLPNSQANVMHVAISLGLYIAERNEGVFKNEYISFSGRPNFHKVPPKLSLKSRYGSILHSGEDCSTNIQGVFEVMLATAKRQNLKPEDLPQKLLIFSDMEFNSADGGYTNFEAIERRYQESGYPMPTLVFWNLNGRTGNVPVKFDQKNVALVSGFSPAIVKAVLGGVLDPLKVMLKAISDQKYAY